MCCGEGGTDRRPTIGQSLGFVQPSLDVASLGGEHRRLNIAQTDKIYVRRSERRPSEEVALSRFTERGYSGDTITVDRELRQELLDRTRRAAARNRSPSRSRRCFPRSTRPRSRDDHGGRAARVDQAAARSCPVVAQWKVAEYQAKMTAATAPGSHRPIRSRTSRNGFSRSGAPGTPMIHPPNLISQAHKDRLGLGEKDRRQSKARIRKASLDRARRRS